MTSPAGISNLSSWHLAGGVAIYIRQSSQRQVDHNIGSRAVQESLRELVVACGWPQDRIVVLRDDLGKSGTSAANRSDFQKLLAMIQAGEIRAVFVHQDDRIARHTEDSLRLFNVLRKAKGFLYINGRCVDMGNEAAADRFINTLFAALAELDNENRVERLGAARVQTARLGFAVTRAPIGYVRATRGKWAKDPNAEVQRIIALVFELAPKFRSLNELMKHMKASNVPFPRYVKGQLQWESVSRGRLWDVLTNPQYTGDFVYQQTKITRDRETGRRTITRRPPEDWLRLPDHHPAYVSREGWRALQDRFAARSPRVRPIVGRGNALLQGRLRCGICRRWMRTQYSERDGGVRTGSYACVQKGRDGKTSHRLSCSARLIDCAVEQEILKALTPAEMQVALDGIAQSLKEQKTTQRSLDRQLRDLDDAADALSREYLAADPNYPRVRNDLRGKWEKVLAEKERLERDVAAASTLPQRTLSAADAHELVQLTVDAEMLWRHPATTHADRKELLGTLISEIIVHASNKETIELEIVWIGGMRQRLRILRPRGVHSLIKEEYQAGKKPATIARELRAAGFRTAKGHLMTHVAVYSSLRQQGLLRPHVRKTSGTPMSHAAVSVS
jgi:DNA invertase Pin-like site-specific DNA recombinase